VERHGGASTQKLFAEKPHLLESRYDGFISRAAHFSISGFQLLPKKHSVPVNSQARVCLARDLLSASRLFP
jgi:hypothetical protein